MQLSKRQFGSGSTGRLTLGGRMGYGRWHMIRSAAQFVIILFGLTGLCFTTLKPER